MIPEASWWRFGRYEIRDEIHVKVRPGKVDGIIVPVSEETTAPYITPTAPDDGLRDRRLIEFNPWEELSRVREEATIPAYAQLRDLVRDVPVGVDPGYVFSESFKKGVCEWCGRYGLLGLLPHNVRSVRIESWQVHRIGSRFEQSHNPDQPFPSEILVEEFGLGTESLDVDVEWWPYFPEVAAKSPMSSVDSTTLRELIPLSKDFWSHYREPLFEFVFHARLFANAIDVLVDPDHAQVKEGYNDFLDHRGAIARLNQLSSVVTQQVRIPENGKY